MFAYSAALTYGILKVLGLVMDIRIDKKAEGRGLDVINHGEEAYTDGEGALLLLDEEINGNGHMTKKEYEEALA